MNTKRVIISALLMFSVVACASNSSDHIDALNGLLANPTQQTLDKWLQNNVTGGEKCKERDNISNQMRAKLFKHITDGNAFAFHASVLMFKCWDGGELEDFYRSAGVFFDSNAVEFLRITYQEAAPDSSIQLMIEMPPLSLTDDVKGKLNLLLKRRNVLNNIHIPEYDLRVKQLTKTLEGRISALRSVTSS